MRSLRPLLVAVLLAAACSSGGDGGAVAALDSTSSSLPGRSEPGAGADAGSGAASPGAAPAGSPPTTSAVAPPAESGVPTTAPAGSATIAPLPVGRLAPHLLRPGNGDRIVLEVRTQAGAAPRQATLDHLLGALRDASGKQVSLDGPDPVGGAARAWSGSDLARTADDAAQYAQGGQQTVLRLLFLAGTFEGDKSVLGVAARGDVAAVFSDQVEAASGVLVSESLVERAVSMHEVGHLLGLVDLFLKGGRGDPDHPGHSRNRSSVMYWAVESDLIGQVLGGGPPTNFDADDRAELAAIRRG